MKEERSGTFAKVVLFFLLCRVFLEIVGILGRFYYPPVEAISKVRDLHYHTPASRYLDFWAHWDSEWWILIAEKGYLSYDAYKDFGGGRYLPQETAKFFPAYPMGIRLLSLLTGNSVVAGLLLSNLAALALMYYVARLGARLFQPDDGVRAALAYIVFPTGFFLSAVYSESLFLASLAAAFCYIEEQKLAPAVLASALAVITRSQAFLAAPALVWLAWQRFPEKRLTAFLAIGFASALPLAGYLLFIQNTFGSIQWIPESIRYWRGDTRYPLYALVRFFSNPIAIHGQHNSIIDFTFAACQLLVLALSFRRLPGPYWLYSAIVVLFPLSSTLFSFSRLCLANIPFFLYVGSRSGRNPELLLVPCLLLQGFFMAAFANGYWVG